MTANLKGSLSSEDDRVLSPDLVSKVMPCRKGNWSSVAVVRSGPVLHDFQRTVDRTDVCRGRTEPDQDRTVKDRSWTVRTGPNRKGGGQSIGQS